MPVPDRSATILTDHDDAWIDQQEAIHWIHGHSEFLWLSERDGWRHIYKVPRAGGKPSLITAGDFDVIALVAIDSESDWIYFIASPGHADPALPFSRSLRMARPRSASHPPNEPGTHDYEISPDARWAIHRFSAFDTIPRTSSDQLASS